MAMPPVWVVSETGGRESTTSFICCFFSTKALADEYIKGRPYHYVKAWHIHDEPINDIGEADD